MQLSVWAYCARSTSSASGNTWKLQNCMKGKSFFQGKIDLEAMGLSNKSFDKKIIGIY